MVFVTWSDKMSTQLCIIVTDVFRAAIRFVMSVHPSAWKNSTLAGRILMKFNILAFFESLSRKFDCL